MKKLIIVAALLVSACASKPDTGLAPAVQIPPIPENLAQKAEPLPPVTDPTMGGLVQANVQSSKQYNSVSFQLNKLIDLYNCVRDSVNNKKEFKCQ
jgi:hypothetical protein